MEVGTCKNCKKIRQKLDERGHCKASVAVTAGENGADMLLAKAEDWATQYVHPAVFKTNCGTF